MIKPAASDHQFHQASINTKALQHKKIFTIKSLAENSLQQSRQNTHSRDLEK